MSAHHTWSGRSMTRSRSGYGYTRCSGLAALVSAAAPGAARRPRLRAAGGAGSRSGARSRCPSAAPRAGSRSVRCSRRRSRARRCPASSAGPTAPDARRRGCGDRPRRARGAAAGAAGVRTGGPLHSRSRYLRTVLRSSPVCRAMADMLIPWRLKSWIMTIPLKTTIPTFPGGGPGAIQHRSIARTGDFRFGTIGEYYFGTDSRCRALCRLA